MHYVYLLESRRVVGNWGHENCEKWGQVFRFSGPGVRLRPPSPPRPEVRALVHEAAGEDHLVDLGGAVDEPRLAGVAVLPDKEGQFA